MGAQALDEVCGTPDIPTKLAAFERTVHDYENQPTKTLDDDIKMGVTMLGVEDMRVKEHLIWNSVRITSWNQMREEILESTRTQQYIDSQPMPMQLGANPKSKGKGKDSKGKGKDVKGNCFTISCNVLQKINMGPSWEVPLGGLFFLKKKKTFFFFDFVVFLHLFLTNAHAHAPTCAVERAFFFLHLFLCVVFLVCVFLCVCVYFGFFFIKSLRS